MHVITSWRGKISYLDMRSFYPFRGVFHKDVRTSSSYVRFSRTNATLDARRDAGKRKATRAQCNPKQCNSSFVRSVHVSLCLLQRVNWSYDASHSFVKDTPSHICIKWRFCMLIFSHDPSRKHCLLWSKRWQALNCESGEFHNHLFYNMMTIYNH